MRYLGLWLPIPGLAALGGLATSMPAPAAESVNLAMGGGKL